MKLVADKAAVSIIDLDAFKKTEREGETISFKYNQRKPYSLIIEIDFRSNQVSIEFPGKILGSHYPQLISKNTIEECFNIISSLGSIAIDNAFIMSNSIAVKADVTKDVKGVDTKRVVKFIKGNILNYNDYVSQTYKNGNFELKKNVTSRQLKKRITIYDKEKEMNKMENRRYAEDNGIVDAFSHTCRFELNLNSAEQVRKALNIKDNKLSSVLNAEANPIEDFLREAVREPECGLYLKDRKAYLTLLVLQDCDYNLEAVEAKERSLHPHRGFNVKRTMEPYRTMMAQIEAGNNESYWQDILNRLKQ